jgi:integrase
MSSSPAQMLAQIPRGASNEEWAELSETAPQLVATMRRYLIQLTTFLAPRSVDVADSTLRQLARWLTANTDVTVVADINRDHIEDYKLWLAVQPGSSRPTMAKNTQRQRLRMIRIFLERLIEWDWPDAPGRNPILHGDIPPRPEPLPKFLSDQDAAKLMAAARAHRLPRYRLVVEMLARTGMRANELCELSADAVTLIGDAYWLRIPVGSSEATATSPCTQNWSSSWPSGPRPTPITSGPRSDCSPTSTHRSVGARSTASSRRPPRRRASATPTRTSSATPWRPRRSTEACASRPSQRC